MANAAYTDYAARVVSVQSEVTLDRADSPRIARVCSQPHLLLCAPMRNCSSLFRSGFFVSVGLDGRLLLGFINHGTKPIKLFRGRRLRAQEGDHHSVQSPVEDPIVRSDDFLGM
jgi:hypothetical protein